jgi:hypothetical protein
LLKNKTQTFIYRAIVSIQHRFSLKEDKAEDSQIDEGLRAGVELKGTNLWVLMFAILIASVGLNVNSTAGCDWCDVDFTLNGAYYGCGLWRWYIRFAIN